MSDDFSFKNYYTQHCVQLLVCTSHFTLLIIFIFSESDGIKQKPTTKISPKIIEYSKACMVIRESSIITQINLSSESLWTISFRVKKMFTLNSHNLVADKPTRFTKFFFPSNQWCYYNWLRYQYATITSNLWSFKPKSIFSSTLNSHKWNQKKKKENSLSAKFKPL